MVTMMQMIDEAMKLIHDHKNEILGTGDWWYALDGYDINVHCMDDDIDQPDAIFHINLYELDHGKTSSYDLRAQHDLTPMTRREIRLL
jgi:hypothetical protein